MPLPNDFLTDEEIEALRVKVRAVIAPILPADKNKSYEFGEERTESGEGLPEYYFVFFVLAELLGFPNMGQFEKVSWSIPVDYEGRLALIEHRKFGIGIFSKATKEDEEAAAQIVSRLQTAVKLAKPYFQHLVATAASRSELNVENNSTWLFERYEFCRDSFAAKVKEAEERKNESHVEKFAHRFGSGERIKFIAYELYREAEWLGVSAVEAFFSWTEHVLIHIAILQGHVTTGTEVEKLARADWQDKVKAAVDVNDPAIKPLYDELLTIRKQIRNHIAHGSFGKNGEAFRFHSRAGAVSVLLTDEPGKFALSGQAAFKESRAIEVAEAFIQVLSNGPLAAALLYIHSDLPTILTYTKDERYRDAMASTDTMREFVEHLSREVDRSANMDF